MSHRTMIMVKRTYLHVAIVTLITAFVWLAITIYQSLVSPAPVKVDQTISSQFTPTLDEKTLELLISRSDLQDLRFEEAASPSALVVTESFIAPEAEIDESPSASESPESASE